jgi:hypothetical protein
MTIFSPFLYSPIIGGLVAFVAIILAVLAVYFRMRTKREKAEIQIDNKVSCQTPKTEGQTSNVDRQMFWHKKRLQMETIESSSDGQTSLDQAEATKLKNRFIKSIPRYTETNCHWRSNKRHG